VRSGLRQAGWAPAFVFGLHVVAKSGLRWYDRFRHFDDVVHLAGGMAIAWYFHVSLREAVDAGKAGRPSAPLSSLLVASLTCSAAVVWEFLEYLSDQLLRTRWQSSLEDTLTDLVFGTLGGLAVAAAAWRRSR